MITGERVRLRGIEKEDVGKFVLWLNDPEVTQHLLMYWPLTNAQEEKWFDDLKNLEPAAQPLAIEVKTEQGWQLVGNCSYHHLDWRNRSGEVGIFIGDKNFWGQGYGREAMNLLLQFGFNRLNLNRVYLQVFETNPRAIRAYQQAGFIQEGRLRQDIFLNGRYIDVLVMGLLRVEWEAKQA
jgi:RimJ/RimL family protein N-acetyltransferase